MKPSAPKTKSPKIVDLLRPHGKAILLGVAAAIGEGIANLLEPVPLKIVLDNVLRSRQLTGWLNNLMLSIAGHDRLDILRFAAISVLAIAALGAICSYVQK